MNILYFYSPANKKLNALPLRQSIVRHSKIVVIRYDETGPRSRKICSVFGYSNKLVPTLIFISKMRRNTLSKERSTTMLETSKVLER